MRPRRQGESGIRLEWSPHSARLAMSLAGPTTYEPPCRVSAPRRLRRDRQRREDPADRGRTGPVTGFRQLALDPLVPPAAVPGGEPPGQRGYLGADRRPAGPVRVSPFAGDQAAVPPQDGAWSDQPVRPQLSRQEPDQGGQDRTVGPVQPGPVAGCGAARRPPAAAPAVPRPWTPSNGRAAQASRRPG